MTDNVLINLFWGAHQLKIYKKIKINVNFRKRRLLSAWLFLNETFLKSNFALHIWVLIHFRSNCLTRISPQNKGKNHLNFLLAALAWPSVWAASFFRTSYFVIGGDICFRINCLNWTWIHRSHPIEILKYCLNLLLFKCTWGRLRKSVIMRDNILFVKEQSLESSIVGMQKKWTETKPRLTGTLGEGFPRSRRWSCCRWSPPPGRSTPPRPATTSAHPCSCRLIRQKYSLDSLNTLWLSLSSSLCEMTMTLICTAELNYNPLFQLLLSHLHLVHTRKSDLLLQL